MSTVGYFGGVTFKVSADVVRTFENMSWEMGARWTEHARHLQDPLPEFIGEENDKVSFPMLLSAFAGVDPMSEVEKLEGIVRSGYPEYLVLGNRCIGKGRWIMKKLKVDMKRFDNRGNLLEARVNVTLSAYPRR